jgi:DNA processing protein
VVIPGDTEWPSQLDMLGDARPWGSWVRGQTDLRYTCPRSVLVVGTRAATEYGLHVGGELAARLAEKGWTIVPSSDGLLVVPGVKGRGTDSTPGHVSAPAQEVEPSAPGEVLRAWFW